MIALLKCIKSLIRTWYGVYCRALNQSSHSSSYRNFCRQLRAARDLEVISQATSQVEHPLVMLCRGTSTRGRSLRPGGWRTEEAKAPGVPIGCLMLARPEPWAGELFHVGGSSLVLPVQGCLVVAVNAGRKIPPFHL